MESEKVAMEDELKINQLEKTVRIGVEKLSQFSKELETTQSIISQQKEIIKNYEEKIYQLKTQLNANVNIKHESTDTSQIDSDVSRPKKMFSFLSILTINSI